MKCSKCEAENIIKACYCRDCANEFSKKEREEAFNKTIYGKISKLEKAKEIITLEIITSNPIFRIAVLVLILICGILVGRPHGDEMTILKNSEYSVSQNTENNDYYILTDKEEISLELYLPKTAEKLTLYKYQGEALAQESEISADSAITVQASADIYYIINADYENDADSLKLYVIPK